MVGERREEITDWTRAERVTERVLAVYGQIFGSLDALLHEAGIERRAAKTAKEILASLPLSSLARLTGIAMRQLAAQGNIAAGRPPLRFTHWNMILYSLSGARTLREGVARCIECFEAIDWRCGKMSLSVHGERAELELDAMRPGKDCTADCLVDLFGLTEIHWLLSWLIGRTIKADFVMLNHDEQIYRALELPSLPFILRFDGGWTGFAFDAAFLDYPVVRSAEELAERPRQSLLFAGESKQPQKSVAEWVREISIRSLRDTHMLPGFDAIVAATAQSEATLRRRLAKDGTSFRQIRESCRREMAFDLLRRTTLPIEEISSRLDYCDADAFRQAFRKWEESTPSEFRRREWNGA